MARYKPYDYTQAKLLPITFSRQILPGTFEHTLHHIVERELDLSIFESRYKKHGAGASAYDSALLLKIVLLAYSRGVISSRAIERVCREKILFMTIPNDTQFIAVAIGLLSAESLDELLQLKLLGKLNSLRISEINTSARSPLWISRVPGTACKGALFSYS
jgi:hypothetical protein